MHVEKSILHLKIEGEKVKMDNDYIAVEIRQLRIAFVCILFAVTYTCRSIESN